MQPLNLDESIRNIGAPPRRRRHSRHSAADDVAEWLSSPSTTGPSDRQRVESSNVNDFDDFGVSSDRGEEFFKRVPPLLGKIRLQLCRLSRAQDAAERISSLSSLATCCQLLAGYSRTTSFYALAQVASALEVLVKELAEHPEPLEDAVLRTLAQAVDLLNTLISTVPSRMGRAEGARVLVVDDDGSSRNGILASLEPFSVTGVDVASAEAALGLLTQNVVDLVVLRSDSEGTIGAELCQAIRRLPQHAKTPILVLASKPDWENWAVFAMSGATEVVQGKLRRPELALKVLGHFFRFRLSSTDFNRGYFNDPNQ